MRKINIGGLLSEADVFLSAHMVTKEDSRKLLHTSRFNISAKHPKTKCQETNEKFEGHCSNLNHPRISLGFYGNTINGP